MSIVSIPPSAPTYERASLGGMPPEIKARVVELAWIQDEQFRAVRSSKPSDTQAFIRYRNSFGKSVNALFQVNREFSELSAKYVFKYLRSKHDITCILFQHQILPVRGRHFDHLDLNPGTHVLPNVAKYFASIFVSADQLPNLNSLEIGDQFEELYFSGIADGVGRLERRLVMRSFERLASRVERLVFVGSWTSRVLLQVLRSVSIIRKLDLSLDYTDDPQESRDVLNFISQQTHLEELALNVDGSLLSLDRDALINFHPTSLPRLTIFSSAYWDKPLSSLLSRFSGQLLQLTTPIEYFEYFEDFDISSTSLPSAPTLLSFPLLRKLELSPYSETQHFFQRLKLSSFKFPEVHSLVVPQLGARQFSAEHLSNLLDHFPSLVELAIEFRPPLSAIHSTHLLQLCAQRKLHFKSDSLYSPFTPSKVDQPMTLAEHGAREDCLVDEAKRVVNLTARRIERLDALGDVREIEKMMPIIRDLAEVTELEKD